MMTSEDPVAVKVLEDLKGGPYACTSLVPISGGSANFTYRGILTTPRPDLPSVFVKHAEPYVASNNTYPLDVSRSVLYPPRLTPNDSTDFDRNMSKSCLRVWRPCNQRNVEMSLLRLLAFTSTPHLQTHKS
jgi:hypothetical protein